MYNLSSIKSTRMAGVQGFVGAQHAFGSRPQGEATEEGGSYFDTSAPWRFAISTEWWGPVGAQHATPCAVRRIMNRCEKTPHDALRRQTYRGLGCFLLTPPRNSRQRRALVIGILPYPPRPSFTTGRPPLGPTGPRALRTALKTYKLKQ